jgi:hypothetical protein
MNPMKRRTFIKATSVLTLGLGATGVEALFQKASAHTTETTVPLFELRSTGIWSYTGTPLTGWQQIEAPARVKQIASMGTDLYHLNFDGSIWHWKGTPNQWEQIQGRSSAVQLAVSNLFDDQDGHPYVFQLRADGSIWQWGTGTNWTSLGTVHGAISMAADPVGLHVLSIDGSYYFHGSSLSAQWQLIEKNPQLVAIVRDNASSYELYADGKIYYGSKSNGDYIGTFSGVRSLAYSNYLALLQNDGSVWQYQNDSSPFTPDSWVKIDSGHTDALALAAYEDGSLFQLRRSGVWLFTGTAGDWTQLDNTAGIRALTSGPTRVAHR